MKICYFGIYKPDYSRNKILISGLRQNDAEVIECRTDKVGLFKYFDLIKKHWSIRNNYQVMVVGYPGFQCVLLAKFLTRKPIIFDAFVSMYDSMVSDRKRVSLKSLRAKYLWWLDKLSMSIADIVLMDTYQHIKYVCKEFNLSEVKFRRIFVGSDIDIFHPMAGRENDGNFKIIFYGTYIPLQGIEYIVSAAKLLEEHKDIVFEIIGSGQESKNIRELSDSLGITNVIYRDNLPIKDLAKVVSSADLCLGIFGNTDKARRVIPNKVFECVAMGKTVVTGDSEAIDEFFDIDDIFRAKLADPISLKEAILRIKSDRGNSEIVARNGYNKLIKKATPKVLGGELRDLARGLLK